MSVIELVWIALPAFVANMLPVVAARTNLFPPLNVPIHREAFGHTKTWRGLFVGVIGGCVVTLVQYALQIPILDSLVFALAFGALAGCGALCGDLAESFIKRRLHIESGRPFIPFDQIDYMCGFLLFTYTMNPWTFSECVTLITIALVATPIVNITAYYLGIKSTYW